MPDPFRQVHPGDPVTYSAIRENAVTNVAQWFAKRKLSIDTDREEVSRRANIIRVHNNTGMALDARSVLGLDVPTVLPSDDLDKFLQEVVFEGVLPTNKHRGLFVVTLEPVNINMVVRAYISGVCQVSINVINAGHAYADVSPGEVTNLRSCGVGSAKILWIESGGSAAYDDNAYGMTTGDKWAIVRLGNEAGRSRGCMAPSGGIPAASSSGTVPGHAVCTMYDWDPGTHVWVSSGITETVYNNGSAATSASKIILVTYHQGDPFAVVDQC